MASSIGSLLGELRVGSRHTWDLIDIGIPEQRSRPSGSEASPKCRESSGGPANVSERADRDHRVAVGDGGDPDDRYQA